MVEVKRYTRVAGDPDALEKKITSALKEISFPGYNFILHRLDAKDGGAQFFLQVCKLKPMDAEGLVDLHSLQHYSFGLKGDDDEQLVRAVYEQISMMEMHEVAEHFSYKGRRIYQPHIHPETLKSFVDRLHRKVWGGLYQEKKKCL